MKRKHRAEGFWGLLRSCFRGTEAKLKLFDINYRADPCKGRDHDNKPGFSGYDGVPSKLGKWHGGVFGDAVQRSRSIKDEEQGYRQACNSFERCGFAFRKVVNLSRVYFKAEVWDVGLCNTDSNEETIVLLQFQLLKTHELTLKSNVLSKLDLHSMDNFESGVLIE
ncbi:hypothetical protein QAD02_017432 [Eretmocerus hayati]|uniref:Uncharacterized protein n=1 Tax=Eretmocerus hayati TaxID=131215 RepID=A0ACC2PDK0_9HYME|nr:hypothetical protein QAD02_017432 [Eretmocerus hayati]